ncbi:hypothetical protein DPMN_117052 [Dreissena polymorpha]|uniref:Uncharacterized protein n=1 Tax=Dreissena polymorpha TaxID=45954 RepID=A0A9D4KPA6_DREPO|nr:hypothetical protein DPMN_117052 [Dreissena polymorpha]
MLAGRPRAGNGAKHKVKRCRNEKVIVKGNCGWVWPMWAGPWIGLYRVKTKFWRGVPGFVMGPCIVEIDRIVIGDVQYQFEVNRCRNEDVNCQGSGANIVKHYNSVIGYSGHDERTGGQTAEITTN